MRPVSGSDPSEGEDPEAVYEIQKDGDGNEGDNEAWVTPSQLAQGPWHPDSQHGGAVCGLLTRMLERQPVLAPMRYARISFDLMRRIPLGTLRASARILRDGKRIQLVEASLFDGGSEVARATGQRIRLEPGLATGSHVPDEQPLPLPPGTGASLTMGLNRGAGFGQAVDFLRADGEPDGKGARVAWVRLRVPFVRGEAITPLVRLTALCDFTSGVASALDFTRYTSINPDLSLHVHRYPESEWIALRGTTELRTDGTGQSEAEIFDERGRIARAMTSLLVSRLG